MGSRLLQSVVFVLVCILLMYVGWPVFDSIGTTLVATNEDKIYYNAGYDDGSCAIYGQREGYQYFTVSTAFTLTHVKLRLYRVGTPGTVTMSIQSTVVGEPSGTVLESAMISSTLLTTDLAGTWVTFTPDNLALVATTEYAIVLSCSGSSANYVVWLVDDSAGSYTGGLYGFSSDGGATWISGNLC